MLFYTMVVDFGMAANSVLTQYVSQEQEGEWILDSVGFVPNSDGALAIDGTNYITATIKQGATSLGTWTTNTGGTAHVAGTRIAPALSGGSALEFGQGDMVTIDIAKAGTGGVFKGSMALAFRKKAADSHYT